MSYKILTDSTCDLPIELVRTYNIDIVNFILHMEGQDYVDDLGATFDKETFVSKLKQGALATTSQVSTGAYYEKFKQYAEQDMPVLYLALSSELSGSYQSAVSALGMLKEEYPECDITIVDTGAVSLGEGLLVYEVAKLKEQGSTLSEVVQWVTTQKERVHSWVTVDDIKHLQRGGRISATSAALGTLLNVKPIITINKNGKLVPFGKVRGRKKALQFLADRTLEFIDNSEKSTIFIGHLGAKEEAEELRKKLTEKLDVPDIQVAEFGPSISIHIGYGAVAVFFMGKTRDFD